MQIMPLSLHPPSLHPRPAHPLSPHPPSLHPPSPHPRPPHPLSRRKLLAASAAGTTLLLLRRLQGGDAPRPGGTPTDPHRVALLSDTHIAADLDTRNLGVNMADHLQLAVKQVASLSPAPAFAIVNGDCAFKTGQSADYAAFLKLLQPLRDAGLPLHLALGNHDDRGHFWKAVPADAARDRAIADREALLIRTPRANWVMLDSLDRTNQTPGLVGPAQLKWLAGVLDREADRPAIVMVHHNPQAPIVLNAGYGAAAALSTAPATSAATAAETNPATNPATAPATSAATAPATNRATAPATNPATAPATAPSGQITLPTPGLIDSDQLLQVLLPRKQVKALLFGHTHNWDITQKHGMHLINLPAVAYVFNPLEPSGWVDAHVGPTSLHLTLNCLDPAHRWHGQTHDLAWR